MNIGNNKEDLCISFFKNDAKLIALQYLVLALVLALTLVLSCFVKLSCIQDTTDNTHGTCRSVLQLLVTTVEHWFKTSIKNKFNEVPLELVW